MIYRQPEAAKFSLAICSVLFSRKQGFHHVFAAQVGHISKNVHSQTKEPEKEALCLPKQRLRWLAPPIPLPLTFLYIFCNLNLTYCCLFPRSFDKNRSELVLSSSGLNKFLTACTAAAMHSGLSRPLQMFDFFFYKTFLMIFKYHLLCHTSK